MPIVDMPEVLITDTSPEKIIKTLSFLSGKEAYDFLARYRATDAYKKLTSMNIKDMNPVECLCFALTSDDISGLSPTTFFEALFKVNNVIDVYMRVDQVNQIDSRQ